VDRSDATSKAAMRVAAKDEAGRSAVAQEYSERVGAWVKTRKWHPREARARGTTLSTWRRGNRREGKSRCSNDWAREVSHVSPLFPRFCPFPAFPRNIIRC